jgi:putative addiction module component (TIGR02574 family)
MKMISFIAIPSYAEAAAAAFYLLASAGASHRYNGAMVKEAAEVLRDGLNLPPEARAAVASSLLKSLDPESDADAEQQWREEIVRRLAEIDSGAVEMIPWEDARRRLWSPIKP